MHACCSVLGLQCSLPGLKLRCCVACRHQLAVASHFSLPTRATWSCCCLATQLPLSWLALPSPCSNATITMAGERRPGAWSSNRAMSSAAHSAARPAEQLAVAAQRQQARPAAQQLDKPELPGQQPQVRRARPVRRAASKAQRLQHESVLMCQQCCAAPPCFAVP